VPLPAAAPAARPPAALPAEGRFSGGHLLALLAHFERGEATGALEIQAPPRRLWICLLGGRIAWAEADGGPDLGQVLVQAGVLGRGALDALGPVTDEDGLMERAAEQSGRSRAELEPLRHELVRARVAGAVAWGDGSFRFQAAGTSWARPGRLPLGVDPGLLPDFSLPRIGWDAVRKHVSRDRMRADVLDPVAGALVPGPGLDAALAALPLPPSLAGLGALLAGPITVPHLRASLGDDAPELISALWLLERAGWLQRSHRGPTPVEPGAESRGSSAAEGASAQAERLLAWHWDNRRTDDLYALLGVRPYASGGNIERAADERLGLWRPLASDPRRDGSARKVAATLVAAVELARFTLADDARREEYEAARKARQGHTVADAIARIPARDAADARLTGVGAGYVDALARGRQRLLEGDLPAALDALRRAYEADPDDPDALAELAWAAWLSRGEGEIGEDPDALLARALALDPGHARAREVRDDLARQRQAGEGTRKTLMGWLRGKA
jgi:hypothetical protein